MYNLDTILETYNKEQVLFGVECADSHIVWLVLIPTSFEELCTTNLSCHLHCNAFYLPRIDYMEFDIYNTNILLNRNYTRLWINPAYEELVSYLLGATTKETYNKYKVEILQRSCKINVARAPSSEEFSQKLSPLEQKALTWVRAKLPHGGNFSVVKAIQETGISRPMWTSLFAKMKEHHFAIVENQGVKGTHIEFL